MAFILLEGDTGDGVCLSPEHNVLGIQVPTPATTVFDDSLAKNTEIGNRPIVLRDSKGTATCGHTTTATTGATAAAGRVFCENKGVHCDTIEFGTGVFDQGGNYIANQATNFSVLVNGSGFPPKIQGVVATESLPRPFQAQSEGTEGFDFEIYGKNLLLFGVPIVRFGSETLNLEDMLLIPTDPITGISTGPLSYSRSNQILSFPYERILFSVPAGEEGTRVSVAVQTTEGQDRIRNVFEYTEQN